MSSATLPVRLALVHLRTTAAAVMQVKMGPSERGVSVFCLFFYVLTAVMLLVLSWVESYCSGCSFTLWKGSSRH